ncbi:MAG: MFS transporter [Terriglobales bacterium]|jgi:predicted MFS family arabinose efflux permease
MITEPFNRLPKVSPNSMLARVLLAFLATAGFFYVNIMPALVDGLKVGLGFTNKQAGLVGSCNVYGAACGAFLIAFLVRRIHWRSTAHLFLLGLIGMDLLSMLVKNPFALMGARFLHGFIGGMLVGISFSIFARTTAPDRTFGVLLLVQVFAGGLGVMSLPLLVPRFGTNILFVTLILFSVTTLVMLQFLPDYPVKAPAPRTPGAAPDKLQLKPLLLAMFSVFFFQAGNMGLFAFIIGLGKYHGLEVAFVSETLGIANWFATLGAVLVIVISTRFGIFKPILGGMLLTLAGTYVFNYSEVKWIWIAANIGTGITWNFVISHLLGMCARFDRTGQTAVWGGFASKMGLASGPMLFSFIVGAGNYSALIATALVLLAFATFASAIPAWVLDQGAVNDLPDAQSARAVS